MLAYRYFGNSSRCIHGTDAVASGCVHLVDLPNNSSVNNNSTLTLPLSTSIFVVPSSPLLHNNDSNGPHPPGSEYSPCVTTVWKSCSKSGWFFLGELDKYVSLSPKRFTNISCTSSGVMAYVTGSVGEMVELTALEPMTTTTTTTRTRSISLGQGQKLYKVIVQTVTIPQSQIQKVTFEEPNQNSSSIEPPHQE